MPELHELADAFPPTCGQLPHAQGAEAQNNPPASGSTNHAAASMAKSPSRPSSPYTVGQEVHINGMPRNSVQGIPGDDVVTLINTRSASFQSTKGEYHQHQEQHTVLNPHSQSQFLLTISTPSQSGDQSLVRKEQARFFDVKFQVGWRLQESNGKVLSR